jgi:hypothetical protein
VSSFAKREDSTWLARHNWAILPSPKLALRLMSRYDFLSLWCQFRELVLTCLAVISVP